MKKYWTIKQNIGFLLVNNDHRTPCIEDRDKSKFKAQVHSENWLTIQGSPR